MNTYLCGNVKQKARNIMKYNWFLQYEIEKYEGKRSKKTLGKESTFKDQEKGILCPQIKYAKGKRLFHKEPGRDKILDFMG